MSGQTMGKRLLLASIALIAIGACSVMRPHGPVTTDLTGIWQIDDELSGRPSTLPEITRFKLKDDEGEPDILAQLASARLDMQQSGTELTITYADGTRRSLDWSGRQHGAIEARWQDDKLVVTWLGEGKQRLTRTFIPADAGKSLTIVTVYNKLSMMQMYHMDTKATAAKYGAQKGTDS